MTVSGDLLSNTNGNEQEDIVRKLVPTEHVGFDSLPNQYVKKTIRDGFVFNILVVGATAVGKSTLIDSLFNTRFPDNSAKSHTLKNVDLNISTHDLVEKHIKLKLGIIETMGFDDQINKGDCFKNIVEYIDNQYEKYLQEELKIHRSQNIGLTDTRVHCCLYLISPIGHGLRAIDLITLKELQSKVNVIPVIAKADIITKNELNKLKSKIMSEIIGNCINIYNFPVDDADVTGINTQMNGLLPFAIVASHDIVKVGNKQVRARQYSWGTVQVENEAHSDFSRLREMLLKVNMEDLREKTHAKHYELYRRTRLEQMGFGDVVNNSKTTTFQETFEARRSAHLAELKQKEEEMRQSFVLRVKEKEAELKEAERQLHLKFDSLKKNHQEEKKHLEDEKKRLEDAILVFNQKKTSVLQGATAGIPQINQPHVNQSMTSLVSTLGGKNKKK